MLKPRPISGFPEWLPAQRLRELEVLDTIRSVYELYGYTSLETPACELIEVLCAKGVEGKEIYALERLEGGSKELALHFDLTVPFARYVAQNYGQLSFPFKRYQIQKVWRGERPAQGRFREFYQADIDVVAEDKLALHFDAEMPQVLASIFARIGVRAEVRVNNRKVLMGAYQAMGVTDVTAALREVDKLARVGPSVVATELGKQGLPPPVIERCLALASARGLAESRRALEGLSSGVLEQGLEELEFVAATAGESVVVDLGIVRGLDYYTGTIYEGVLVDNPAFGAVCSGGRYDDLCSEFINRKLPGVGMSIGVTRLLAYLFGPGGWKPLRSSPTEVLVVLPSEEMRAACAEIASRLRSGGVPTEIYHEPSKLDKQVRYADRKGIGHVLFPYRWNEGLVEIKTLASGTQESFALEDWVRARSRSDHATAGSRG